ncbi:hypothetical protein ACN4FE_08695 [Aliarcobacter butzleri]|uniref:hypothetical protein n=1 Tax=Aliarcobacter butzleri TaxID=28197 RepID=UPI003AF791E1
MLLNKANDENMLRHIFIDLDNYKYHAQPCIFKEDAIFKIGSIKREEFIFSGHLKIKSDEKYCVIFNEFGYGFFIDKEEVEKKLKKMKLGQSTIQLTIEELENYLFSKLFNLYKENIIEDKKEQK